MEAIAIGLEAIASRSEAIASRLEAIALRLEATSSKDATSNPQTKRIAKRHARVAVPG